MLLDRLLEGAANQNPPVAPARHQMISSALPTHPPLPARLGSDAPRPGQPNSGPYRQGGDEMMTVHEVDCLLESMDSVVDLLGQLNESEWRVPSLCPAWQVRHVVAHLDGIEEALSRWRPPRTPRRRSRSSEGCSTRWTTGRRTGCSAGLIPCSPGGAPNCWPRRTACSTRCRGLLLGCRPTAGSWPSATSTSGSTSKTSEYPLGRPGHTSGPAAELALDEVRRSFGYIVGKRAGIPDGSSVLVELTGPIEAHLAAVVDGRARVVDDLDHPDAVVRTDFLTFMLLACGRTDPEAHLAAGDIELQGNKELAGQLARNLRFTI